MKSSSSGAPVAAPGVAPARRRGRPPKDTRSEQAGNGLSRETIIERAVEIARSETLEELSMMRLAREFGVTPALIHYYVGNHDDLLSGVINRYFRERAEKFSSGAKNWRADIESIARTTYEVMSSYQGVASYIASHNRFRVFQNVAPGESDYGLIVFDRTADALRRAGLSPSQAGMAFHLLMQHIVACANAKVRRQLPASHRSFIHSRLVVLDPVTFPGATYIAEAFSEIDAETAFESGLVMLLDGLATWRRAAAQEKQAGKVRAARTA
ncbi:MAG: TetR/AcrR family transcriptional regulator C-terminal domain-containing protein [Pseudomonadota bacterium]